MTGTLRVGTCDFRTLCEFIALHHRHHKPPVGWRFGLAIYDEDRLCAVASCGRPSARLTDPQTTLEITRLCTDSTRHAASKLYAACRQEGMRRGFTRILTYLLEEETGISLRAAGWKFDGWTKGGSWDRPSRHRDDNAPICRKQRWVA